MIKQKKPNPLNVFKIRKLKMPPRHFEYVSIPLKYNLEKSIARWIEDNLRGRFFVGKSLEIDSNNQIVTSVKIGFEDHKELSYFNLACPHLKYM